MNNNLSKWLEELLLNELNGLVMPFGIANTSRVGASVDKLEQALLTRFEQRERELLFEISADLYEIADTNEKPKLVWKPHQKYLDRIAKLSTPKTKKEEKK